MEVGLECLIIGEDVFQCTDCEIMGIVGGCEMSSDGECIFDLAREFERLLDKLYILYTFCLFEFQFGSSL